MLTEDRVVEAVCRHLVAAGWAIEQRAELTQRGYDIVATNADRRLIIEAKGAGSARPGSARFGKAFNSGQVFDHVAKAVLKAMRVVDAGHLGAVALPTDVRHRSEIRSVRTALNALGIGVFWVGENLTVTLEPRGVCRPDKENLDERI